MLLTKETNDFLYTLGLGLRPRAKTTSIAIAKAFADTLSIPSGPVDSIEFLYNTSFNTGVNEKLSALNEITPVDCPTIQMYLLKFYKLRYSIVHAPETIYSFNAATAVTDFFGIGSVMDADTIKLVSEAPTEVSRVYNGIRRYLKECECSQ